MTQPSISSWRGSLRATAPATRSKLPTLTPLAQSNIPGFNYNDYDEFINLSTWWLDRMVITDTPLREKLVLLMHEQFPTSYAKVGYADLMYNQNQIFRTLGAGPFDVLTQAVAKDPAMLIWLDTGTDLKGCTRTRTLPGS